jgi:DNA-binding MarR family transcriptional regulator
MSKKAKTVEKPVATAKEARLGIPNKAPVKKAPAKKQPETVQEPKVVEPAVAVLPIKGEPEPKPTPKKLTGLRKPQIKVLQALAKTDKPLSRKELAEQAGVDQAMSTEYLGSNDEANRLKNDAKVMPSLLTLGYIQSATSSGKLCYTITPSGRKAIEENA